MVHHIPGTVNIEISEMVSVVPFPDLLRIRRKTRIRKQAVDFVLCETEGFIELGVGNGIRYKIIRSCESYYP